MRSWIATGNDLRTAIDIKEGMEYLGGTKNTKVAVAEIDSNIGENIDLLLKKIFSFYFYYRVFQVIQIKQTSQIFRQVDQFVILQTR